MRKTMYGLMIVWLCIFNITAYSETSSIKYDITFDSNHNNEIIYRDHIFDVYERLTYGIDENSIGGIINKNLALFKLDECDEISFNNSVITIIENNGKGSNIKGDFNYVKCMQDVEVKSWIFEKLK